MIQQGFNLLIVAFNVDCINVSSWWSVIASDELIRNSRRCMTCSHLFLCFRFQGNVDIYSVWKIVYSFSVSWFCRSTELSYIECRQDSICRCTTWFRYRYRPTVLYSKSTASIATKTRTTAVCSSYFKAVNWLHSFNDESSWLETRNLLSEESLMLISHRDVEY